MYPLPVIKVFKSSKLHSFGISTRISIMGFAQMEEIAVLPIWLILAACGRVFFSMYSSSAYQAFQHS